MAKTDMEILIRMSQDEAGPANGTLTIIQDGETIVGPESIDCVCVIAKNKNSIIKPMMIGEAKELPVAIYSYYRNARESKDKFISGPAFILEDAAKLIVGLATLEEMDETERPH